MPHTKPITIGIIYRPPNQSKFLDIFEENLRKLDSSYREIYFLGDFNIFENGKYVLDKSPSNNKNLDIGKAYKNFFQKFMAFIDNLAPCKNKRIKGTSQDWFDA